MSVSAQLEAISQLYINGKLYSKLDYLGSISIKSVVYFHVYRRYNSIYEIVLVDANDDFHFHSDVTIGDSIKAIMCLTDEQMEDASVTEAISFKRNSSVHLTLDTRWSYLQHLSQGAVINVDGVQLNYSAVTPVKSGAPVKSEAPIKSGAPINVEEDIKENLFDKFYASKRRHEEIDDSEDSEESEEYEEESEETEETEESEETEEETPLQLTRTYLCLRNRRIRRVTIH